MSQEGDGDEKNPHRMMRKTNIMSFDSPLYSKCESLYVSAFPVFEQRTKGQQHIAFDSSDYHLIAFEDGNIFVGFISCWEFDDYVYVEHFAIDDALRGWGYGSKVLTDFIRYTTKTVLLEIDPVVNEIAAARLRFYKRCGFHVNPYPHQHPAYRSGYEPHQLIVLTTKGEISSEQYQRFRNDLETVVMRH